MNYTRIVLSFFVLSTVVTICLSQRSAQNSTSLDAAFQAPALPQRFETRQQALSVILKTIEQKKYDAAIAQANQVVTEAIANRDSVNLRDAYRLLSKAYHGKEDFKQRDHYEQLIQDLAVAYGYHLDEALSFIHKSVNPEGSLHNTFDELLLLEDPEGKLSFDEVSSPLF